MDRFRHNPFYVLGLRPGCGRTAVEHQGQAVLQMLAMGIAGASSYTTPLGTFERTAEDVHAAMHALRDAQGRARYEPWAALPPQPPPEPPPDRRDPWPDALRRFGWPG